MRPRIAVLLACHNRKAATLSSLARLQEQDTAAQLEVFLVDDASSDGTAEAVRARFPQVRMLRGSGQLFWCGAMRRALATALERDFDFYLWLNDDTTLDLDAVRRLLEAHEGIAGKGSQPAIVVGSTRDPRTGEPTYGGVVRASRLHPLKYRLLAPGAEPRPCHSMNGNCVLIPRDAAARAGNLSPEFSHGIGDFDYGLRARRAGCGLWVVPATVGTCARNSAEGGFRDPRLPWRERLRAMFSRKGLPPGEYLAYARRHGGPLWPFYWALPYAHTVVACLFRRVAPASARRPARIAMTHRIRVAFVTNFCTHYTAGLFERLAALLDVDYYFYSPGNEWYWSQHLGTASGRFSFRRLAGFSLGHTRITPALPFRLLAGRYDAYIKCINGKFALPVTYAVARLLGRPFVLRTGIWMRVNTGLQRLLFPLTRYLYRHADAHVVYGSHVKRYLVGEGVRPERVFVSPHAVDNAFYGRAVPAPETAALRARLGIAPGQPVVLYVGRLVPIKGCRFLLQAFSALERDGAVLVLAGSGEGQPELERLAQQGGMGDAIRFAGAVPWRETPPYYAIASVCVLPSITTEREKETWGLVVNEAFNQGVPVIVTNSVGAAAGGLVEHGVNGLVVPEADWQGLADALRLLLRHEGLRRAMGNNARQRIQTWTHERMAEAFAQAVRYALGEGPAADISCANSLPGKKEAQPCHPTLENWPAA